MEQERIARAVQQSQQGKWKCCLRITTWEDVMQRSKLDDLLGWYRMACKPTKSRSLALVKGKIRRNVFFDLGYPHTVGGTGEKSWRGF